MTNETQYKEIEVHDIDKSNWPEGEWKNEPDYLQYRDEETGLECLIIRNIVGALCGYVGVDKNHPAYKVDAFDWSNPSLENIDVHWGLTFSGFLDRSNTELWFLGFDCAHSGDLAPGHNSLFECAVQICLPVLRRC
ncbi:MAG: hypothetical protein AAF228_13715 [Pseudomonadota bacterium]